MIDTVTVDGRDLMKVYNSSFIANEKFHYFSHPKPFLANAPILYPLKTLEMFLFSGVLRG